MEAAEKKAAARQASVTTILVEGSVKLGAAMIRETHSATNPYLSERLFPQALDNEQAGPLPKIHIKLAHAGRVQQAWVLRDITLNKL